MARLLTLSGALLAAAAAYAAVIVARNAGHALPTFGAHKDSSSVHDKSRHLEVISDTIATGQVSVAPGHEQAACKLSGQIVDCGCDFASVEGMNHMHLYPLLTKLTKQPFYRFFKVNLYCDCQFWPDSGMCSRRDCAVNECGPGDIPDTWLKHDKALEEARSSKKKLGQVDRSVDEGVEGTLTAVVDWRALNNPWLPDDDDGGAGSIEYLYVDLQRNEEKYTGYKGEDARKIWAAIYDQSVLKEVAQAANGAGEVDVPREQQVLYRLISGMHTSITTSIVKNYYDEETETWGPNMPFFKARFAAAWAKPHIENLYFTLLFVLRATTKAAEALKTLDYGSGWGAEQAQQTQKLVSDLLTSPELQAACPVPFDEGMLWRQDPHHHDTLRQQLQKSFHNITRLMDCVGCEKCKLNGKLNMLGIATALRVLFAQPEAPASQSTNGVVSQSQGLVLERNEAIALVNFLAKLSDSVETIRSLSIALKEQQEKEAATQTADSTAAAAAA